MHSNGGLKQSKIHFMTECAIFTAIICILSPIAIPFGPVPITFSIFAVMLTGIILDWKKSLVSVLLFEFIGVCGLPVFAGARGGINVIFGPTGGFVWSYLLCVLSVSALSKIKNGFFAKFIACLSGLAICYIFGTLHFALFCDIKISQALKICVYPFVLFDLIKAAYAAILGNILKKRMRW